MTVLGSGTSFGVPVIGCRCGVCTSLDSRNRRLRVSLLARYSGRGILIDASPDLRQQALTHRIERVDALLLTHAHADHLHGLDDLRVYCGLQKERIPCFATRQTLARASRGFDYAFAREERLPLGAIPQLVPRPLGDGSWDLFGLRVRAIALPHGRGATTAFRFGDAFAYVTDVSDIPPSKLDSLRGLDVLILDCLRREPHPTHLHLERALELIALLKPGRTYLTHIAHDIDHAELEATLPPAIRVAYDGLQLEVEA